MKLVANEKIKIPRPLPMAIHTQMLLGWGRETAFHFLLDIPICNRTFSMRPARSFTHCIYFAMFRLTLRIISVNEFKKVLKVAYVQELYMKTLGP
jgi:hypothetical protein